MAIQAQLYSENPGFSLGVPQDMMDNVCGGFNEFCFNNQKQQQHHQILQKLQQRNQNSCFNNVLLPKSNNSNNNQIMGFSQSIEAQMEKQRREIDWFISLHNERLRLALQEQRKQETALLLNKYEWKTQFLLSQKDEEISKAMKGIMELENLLKSISMEIQTWQKIAKENESMVISLNNTIDQLRENACLSTMNEIVVEDAESCCETGENRGHEENRGERKLICKGCNSSNSCVILLPCRHLCSCKDCEAFLASCPVCGMVKKASIDVLM